MRAASSSEEILKYSLRSSVFFVGVYLFIRAVIPIIITTRIISPVTISAGNNFFFMCKNPFLLFGVEIA